MDLQSDGSNTIDRIASDEEAYYVASKTRNKFHRPSCEYAQCIPVYKRVVLDSHRDAVAAGYKPCGTCRA